jgi:hypothetical protein
LIEDVSISNITMREIYGAPIFIRLGARMRGPADTPVGTIRRIIVSDLTCVNTSQPLIGSIISGIPGHDIEDLKLADIIIVDPGGGSAPDAALQLAEKEKDYPEPTMFGTTPAHGFFIRHVAGIEMSGIKIEHARPDARPAFVLEDVRDADFRYIKTPPSQSGSTFVMNRVSEFSVFKSKPAPDTELENVEHKEI